MTCLKRLDHPIWEPPQPDSCGLISSLELTGEAVMRIPQFRHARRSWAWWFALPALVTAFLFQHAVQGWCPPVPVLRRMGFRAAHEIEQERTALKALRGDFNAVATEQDKPGAALSAVGL